MVKSPASCAAQETFNDRLDVAFGYFRFNRRVRCIVALGPLAVAGAYLSVNKALDKAMSYLLPAVNVAVFVSEQPTDTQVTILAAGPQLFSSTVV